ncbi:MAG: cupin domain-containing protein [Ardenticatenaceae bacterium]|nr:cupin domain-containing protein [Ardenticatenaceae bacterium]
MQAFKLNDLIQTHAELGKLYYEFIREESMSLGLYILKAGGVDPQQPHNEDEVYYVINGRASITVGDETEAVQPGSTIFVGKHVPHKFHDISEDLTLLVFFAPAEGS